MTMYAGDEFYSDDITSGPLADIPDDQPDPDEDREVDDELVAASGHRFYRTNVGHTICSRCGLIPFDYDAEIPCPGERP